MERCRKKLLLYAVLGLTVLIGNCAGVQNFTNATIISSPAGTPDSGSPNTFIYPILSSVTLTCDTVPPATPSTMFTWDTAECTTCFVFNETTQNATTSSLTLDDAGTFTCTADDGSITATSDPFTLRVSYAPGNVNAMVLTSRSVEVTWDAFPVSSGVTGYNISYTTTASYTGGGTVTVNGATTANHTLTDLEEYTNYTITVRATSNSGMSENSDEVLVTTYTAAPTSPPLNVMVTTLDRASLNVTWQPPLAINQNGPITAYFITYERTGEPIMSMTTTETEYIISGLIPFDTYLVQVAARTVNGSGLFSSVVMQVSGQDVPTAPRSLTVDNTTATTVNLSWMEPTMSNGIIITYRLEYGPVGGDQRFTSSVNLTSLFATVTGLSPNTEYEFRVAAFTRVGPSPYSNTVVSITNISAPVVNISGPDTQTVGQSLMLQCNATIGSTIFSRVDIIWSDSNGELNRTTGVTSHPVGNDSVYTDSYTISQLSTTDEGRVIQCEVAIDTSPPVMASDSITLDVTVPTPTVTMSPPGPIQGAMVGSPQVINCMVSTVSGVESSSVNISWMGPGGSITNDSRVTISITTSNSDTYTSSLQFTYLMEGDEGMYTCNVMILDTSESQSVELNALSIPTPTMSVTDPGTQMLNESLTLQCNVTTVRGITSRVDIVWSSGGIELQRMNDVSSTTMDNSLVYRNSYTISQLSTTDEGRVIQCEVVINASPPVMANDSITLDVDFPDPIVNVTTLSDQLVGQPLTLQCNVTAVRGITSGVVIVWSSGGMELNRTNDPSPTTLNALSVYIDNYVISMLNTSHNTRVYQCMVVINANPPKIVSDSITLNVNVMDPTVNITPPGPIRGAMVGDPLVANCTVSTVNGVEPSTVMITWTGPGVSTSRFSMGNRTSIGNNMYLSTLRISYLLKSDENTPYFCIVTILEGSATESFEIESLSDPDPPVVTISPPSPIMGTTVGEGLNVDCMATTTTAVQADLLMQADLLRLVWTGPGGAITNNDRITIQPIISMGNIHTSTLQFDYLTETDGGNYRCTVHLFNVNGSSSVEIESPDYAPTNVNAIVLSSRSVEVRWNPSHPLSNVTSYRISYTTTASYTSGGSIMVNGSNATNLTITGLEEYTIYTITVQAISGSGVMSGNSDPVSVRTYTDVPDSAPRNVTVNTAHPGSLNITWLPPEVIGQNGPITDYEIQYTMVGSNDTMIETVTSRNMFILTGLFSFVNYSIEIAAVTVNGTGPYSSPIIGESGHEEPSAPRSLMVTSVTYTTVTLSWMAPNMPNGVLIRYDLEYKEVGDAIFSRVIPFTSETSYTITELTPSTTYQFRVAAVTIVGRGPYSPNITNSTLTPTVNIVSSPVGTPVSGSTNTYDYPILSSVTLMCLLNPLPSTNVTYSWNTTRCYRNTNYAGGSSRCFPNSQTTQNVTGYDLTAEDAGTITCTITLNGNEYTSGPYTLRVSSIAITGTLVGNQQIINSNVLNDYSYITADTALTNASVLIARCVTGLGPSGSDNNELGGLYFNGNNIPNGMCDSSVVQPSGAAINFVGVINLFQCGQFSTTGEGVYTCTLQNSSMINQSMRLGIYFSGRTAPVIVTPSGTTVVRVDITANYTLSCVSEGSPPDTFTWQKDDDPTVLQSTSITAVEHTSTNATFRADYRIDSVTLSNNGTYTCTVVNPISSDSANITIMAIVPAPPDVSVSPSGPIQRVMVGNPQVITCTAVTSTLLDVMFEWMGPEGNSITNDSRVTISQTTFDNNNTYTSNLQFAYLMEGDEGNYTCTVSLMSAMSVTGSDSTQILNLIVPNPTVNVTALDFQTVGQSLTLQCNGTTVRGITSRVDIVWSNDDDTELRRMNDVSSTTMDNSLVYTDSYTISQLSTDDDDRVIHCEVLINASALITSTDNITLDVIGEIENIGNHSLSSIHS